jgi:periplasmic divalent cation tolerance protein
MTEVMQVATATESDGAARALAASAVQARLAASAQVSGPVSTAFWHEGTFGQGEEWRVVLVTTAARYPQLEAHLHERHPWSNPEIVAVPLVAGAAAYLEWVARSVGQDPAGASE